MNFEEKLEGLLRSKKFSELTIEEQNYVSDFVSPEEYTNFRLIICAGKNGMKSSTIFPAKRVKENLLATMRAKRERERPITTFLSKVADYQLPMWQAAAMIAGLLFIVSFGKKQILDGHSEGIDAGFAVLVDTVYETKYDTVYRDLPVDLIGKNINVSPLKTQKTHQKIAPSRQNLSKSVSNNAGNISFEIPSLPEAAPLLADTIYPNNVREILPPEKYLWNEKSVGRSVQDDGDLIGILEGLN